MTGKMRRTAAAVVAAQAALVPAAIAGSTSARGCSSLTFGSERGIGSCYLPGVEILPDLHIPQSGIIHSITSAEACHDECLKFADCRYFTFRQDRVSGQQTCHLKPANSPVLSPELTIRIFDASSKYSYVSGPRSCDQTCEEYTEIFPGCGPSTPATCALLKDAYFDDACAGETPPERCGKQGYRCCRHQDPKAAVQAKCSERRVSGYTLTGGTLLPSRARGVISPEECWSLCVATVSCTHWNFISSSNTAFTGGACYLRAYTANPAAPEWATIPKYATSIVGGRDCTIDYGIKEPDDEQKPSEVTCFEKGVDVFDATLIQNQGWASDAQACQQYCQKYDHCVAYIFDARKAECTLKYSVATKYEIEKTSEDYDHFVFGPRDCPNVEPAPAVSTDCMLADTDIDGANVFEEYAPHAAHCGTKCATMPECKAWAYFQKRCYIKGNAEPRVKKAGVISGLPSCTWKDYALPGARRQLTDSKFLAPQLKNDNPLQETPLHTPELPPSQMPSNDAVQVAEMSKNSHRNEAAKLASIAVQAVEANDVRFRGATPPPPGGSPPPPGASLGHQILIRPLGPHPPHEHNHHITFAGLEHDVDAHTSEIEGEGGVPYSDSKAEAKSSVKMSAVNPAVKCPKDNKQLVGGDLETVEDIRTADACHQLCAARADCKYVTFYKAGSTCTIQFGGDYADKMGFVVIPRFCPCNKDLGECAVEAQAVVEGEAAEMGISERSLGTPSEWIVKGQMIDFAHPATWQRMAVLVLTNNTREDCFVSDLLQTDKNCWDMRDDYLPLGVHLQIVSVAEGAVFPGWSEFSWDSHADTPYNGGDFFELFNMNTTITSERQEHGGHGVYIKLLAENNHLPDSWPRNMTAPKNFGNGHFYARLRTLEAPHATAGARLLFCITGTDFPVSEICAQPLVVVPPEM